MGGLIAGIGTRLAAMGSRLVPAAARIGAWRPVVLLDLASGGGSRGDRAPGLRHVATREASGRALIAQCLLGEGPLWHSHAGVLYWLDIMRQKLHAYRPATSQSRTQWLPAPAGAAALCADGRLLLATSRGVGYFDTETARFELFADTAPDWPRSRYNDGKCDRAGRFWTGTMRLKGPPERERLYRLDPDRRFASTASGFTRCNGLGWSPDDRCLYLVDSHDGRVYAYDFDLASGSIDNRRVLAALPATSGIPDGLAVDAEGCIWIALSRGWQLLRLDPAGRVERAVTLPVPRPTSCTFAGPDLKTLYVTSSRIGLSRRDLTAAPLSGSVLELDVGVAGLPEPAFSY